MARECDRLERCGHSRPTTGRWDELETREANGLSESIEQRLRRFQIGGLEALGEPVVDRQEERYCVSGTALIAPKAGEAGGPPQFPGERALPTCPVEGLSEVILGGSRCCGRALQRRARL
jgi:hypothetical protein